MRFWCDLLGFEVVYDRPETGFSYLNLNGAQIMLEQQNVGSRQWLTAKLQVPLGTGINFQIEVAHVDELLNRLARASWPLFMPCEEQWYRAVDVELGVRQFLVQDPDGYLVRLAENIGERPLHRRAPLTHVSLTHVSLTRAPLTRAPLMRAPLTRAPLTRIWLNFVDARFVDARFVAARFVDTRSVDTRSVDTHLVELR